MRATDQTLRYLATRVGTGDHAAFRCLYAMLASATLATVRDDLPNPVQSMHVARATFSEVWWICAFDVRSAPIDTMWPGGSRLSPSDAATNAAAQSTWRPGMNRQQTRRHSGRAS